jgi:hypothetical protein
MHDLDGAIEAHAEDCALTVRTAGRGGAVKAPVTRLDQTPFGQGRTTITASERVEAFVRLRVNTYRQAKHARHECQQPCAPPRHPHQM